MASHLRYMDNVEVYHRSRSLRLLFTAHPGLRAYLMETFDGKLATKVHYPPFKYHSDVRAH